MLQKAGAPVYHNPKNRVIRRMLHNSVNYVNECYQIHKRLWLSGLVFGIFWLEVNIIFLTICTKKLSITGV